MIKKLALAGGVGLGLFLASPAPAASLQLVTNNWGTNGVPPTVSMYI